MTGPNDPPAKPGLADAYGLKTPEDSARLYAGWAETYDAGFVATHDYCLPEQVALAYAGRGGLGPVLDVGAGTGAVGEVLARLGVGPVEATDISREMLEVARGKGVYAGLFAGDVTRELPAQADYFSGCVSAGTFTLGHVGPEALDELMRVTSHGGLICIAVHSEHYASAGFEAKLEALGDRIRDLRCDEVRIFGQAAEHEHSAATALMVSFHKA